MKNRAIKLIAAILGWQVRRLYKKGNFIVIAIAGSVGKTSTKFAVASILSQKYRVRYQEGNYNHLVSVPLVFFGHLMPNPFNPIAWLAIFFKNEKQLLNKYPWDVVVVEVGTDGPGQIKDLNSYLQADIGILTAIAPEHMEFFDSLDAVAKEETSLAEFSRELLVNKELCDSKYLKNIKIPIEFYSSEDAAGYVRSQLPLPQLFSVAVAVKIARRLGVTEKQIKHGVPNIKPVNGRARRLEGVNGSTIIDDTYNASPRSMVMALDILYAEDAPQKIAILGSMNELGLRSPDAHREIGQLCDPKQIDLVVTIGADANRFLAQEAKARGCEVVSFTNPVEAGQFVKTKLKKGALVLAKGSQNGVFAEEAVKVLLRSKNDQTKLVRQGKKWLKTKRKQSAT